MIGRHAAVVAIAAVLGGCDAGDASRSSEPGSAQGPRAGGAGVTVDLPAGWHTTAPVDGNVTDPLTRVAVSSAPLARGSTACQIADYAPQPKAVSLVVVEWKTSDYAHPPPRPARFGAAELALRPPPAIECFDGAGGTAQFTEKGRTFGAYVLLGRDAPRRLAAEVRAVLDTLVVRAR